MLRTNLIVDGNYILYKSVFILNKIKTLYGDLETLLLKDYNNISTYFQYDMIYFVSDSRQSWRKKIYPEYKEGRKRDTDIDWGFVFETYESFKEIITTKQNCQVFTIDHFEGDDIIAHIVRETNKEGHSNIIISNDNDIQQLLNFNTSNDYINIMYNHKFNDERIFVPQNYNIFFNHIEENSEQDIFNLNNDSEFLSFIETLKNKCTLVEVDNEKSYFLKIVTGDKGDNILSPIKIDKTMRGIGKAGCETVWNMYKSKYPGNINFDSNTFVDNLTDIISIYKKIKDKDYLKTIKENIIFSRKLTRLDSNYLPKGMLKILQENINI